jgi:hypothetical protein
MKKKTRKGPRKPDRPIGVGHLGPPYISRERFSQDKDELEKQWAQKFADIFEKQYGRKFTVHETRSEPADVILRDEQQTEIQLQITEAVDAHRLSVNAKRAAYRNLLVAVRPEIKSLCAGFKIYLQDAGTIATWPEVKTADAKAICLEIFHFTRKAIELIARIKTWRPVGGILAIEGGRSAMVAATRYAHNDAEPALWFWGGADWGIGDIRPHYVREAVAGKLQITYGDPGGELWLLVYTVDCEYDSEQESEILADLASIPNFFTRVYVLQRAQSLWQVFPKDSRPDASPGPRARGGTVLGDAAFAPGHEPDYAPL